MPKLAGVQREATETQSSKVHKFISFLLSGGIPAKG